MSPTTYEGNVDLKDAEFFINGLATDAGKILRSYFEKRNFSTLEKSGVDFTTQADTEVDDFLRKAISKKYPRHTFLTEETTSNLDNVDFAKLRDSDNLWIIDPLDGTINFSRNIGHFAISIALMQKDQVVLGIAYAPIEQQLYVARSDKEGAFLNGERIHVSNTKNLREVVLACDWGWDLKKRGNIVEWLGRVSGKIRQVASRGSAVADLASLADGKIDVYFHSGLKPWDTAASAFIIQKSGGKVTDVDSGDWSAFKKEILATNGLLHHKILNLLGKNPILY